MHYVGLRVSIRDLINSWRNLGQVLVDAGHSELDLVADTVLWTFGCVCSRDAEEQAEQQDPEGVETELGVHLRGTISIYFIHTILCTSNSCFIIFFGERLGQ